MRSHAPFQPRQPEERVSYYLSVTDLLFSQNSSETLYSCFYFKLKSGIVLAKIDLPFLKLGSLVYYLWKFICTATQTPCFSVAKLVNITNRTQKHLCFQVTQMLFYVEGRKIQFLYNICVVFHFCVMVTTPTLFTLRSELCCFMTSNRFLSTLSSLFLSHQTSSPPSPPFHIPPDHPFLIISLPHCSFPKFYLLPHLLPPKVFWSLVQAKYSLHPMSSRLGKTSSQ